MDTITLLKCQMVTTIKDEGKKSRMEIYCRTYFKVSGESKVIFCEKCMQNSDFPGRVKEILDEWELTLEQATGGEWSDPPIKGSENF